MLVRNPRKLVRPGQWVLAKVSETSWIKRRSYDFRDRDVAYVCIVPTLMPTYGRENGFDWHYRVYWRFPFTATPGEWPCEGERYTWPWSHHAEYRVINENKDGDTYDVFKDNSYHVANAWDFDLLEYNGSGQPGPWDEEESNRRHGGAGGYLYEPASDDSEECPGSDYSLYFCSECNKFVVPWSDDEGNLVCAGCTPLIGLIYTQETADQIDRARALADFVGPKCRHSLERSLRYLDRDRRWNEIDQRAYLNREDKFSFYFSLQAFHDGEWKQCMNGGLIMHGPHVDLQSDGSYKFTTWDYGLKCSRLSTPEEIHNISWSTHT